MTGPLVILGLALVWLTANVVTVLAIALLSRHTRRP